MCKVYSTFLLCIYLEQKYSAVSLRSITSEVLKVLNATEDLIHGSMGDGQSQTDRSDVSSIPPAEARRLDEQLSRLEENVCILSEMNICHATGNYELLLSLF